MQFPLFISKKYLRSNKDSKFVNFISGIAITGIAIGVSVLIIALTVLSSFEDAITEKVISLNSHIKITAFGKRNLPHYKETSDSLKKLVGDNLLSVAPFMIKDAIIKSRRLSEGINLYGITNVNGYSGIEDYLIEGNIALEKITDDLPSIVIGKKLSERLFLNLGDKTTIFSLQKNALPSEENPPTIEQFRVIGIYESGMSEYDDLKAYIDLNYAQQIFALGDQVSGYDLKLKSIAEIDSTKKLLENYLRYPYYVRTIFRVHHAIFSWLELQKKPIPIVLGLIIIVAVFNIVGTLLMIVLERTSAIGILRAMGATRKQIIQIFLIQGIYLAVIGISVGVLLTLALSLVQINFELISIPDSVYFLSKVPIDIDVTIYLLVSSLTFILCITASLIPSIVASKIKPISAIRFD